MIAVDTGFLILLFGEKGSSEDQARVKHLVHTLSELGERIIIPTPVLAEYLVRAPKAAAEIINELRRRDAFRVCNFDERAALECSLAIRNHLDQHGKAGTQKSWQAVKFDYQIAAIARVNGAKVLYATDGNLRKFAEQMGLKASDVSSLALPPEEAQYKLFATHGSSVAADASSDALLPQRIEAKPKI